MAYEGLVRAFNETVWALLPQKLAEIREVLEMRVRGGMALAHDEVSPAPASGHPQSSPSKGEEVRAAAVGRGVARQSGAVAVIPMYGVMAQRMNIMMAQSGGVSTEMVGKAIDQAVNEPGIKAIVLDIDSPGGTTGGVPELAAKVLAARDVKPVIAVSNSMMASAAYFVGASASEVVVTPSSWTGSIGVYMEHVDISRALENEGVVPTLISAGKHKIDGNPYGPLDDETRAYLQGLVDDAYGQFVAAVAKGRGVSASAVRSGFGEGRVVTAKDAVRLGMADRIDTLEGVLARLGAGGSGGGARAAAFAVTVGAGGGGSIDAVDLDAEDPSPLAQDDKEPLDSGMRRNDGKAQDLAEERDWFRRRVGVGREE